MESSVERWRRRLAIHGSFIFVVGAIGFGIMFAQAHRGGPVMTLEAHRWSVAHMQGITHTFLLFGLAALLGSLRLTRFLRAIVGGAAIVGAWGALLASFVSAAFAVSGRSWNPTCSSACQSLTPAQLLLDTTCPTECPPFTSEALLANEVAFVVFGIGVLGTGLAFTVIVLRAAWEALRDGVAPDTWSNWARNVRARPRRVPEPGNLAELENVVDAAIKARRPLRAFGARGTWSPMAVSHGTMVDMSRLDEPLHFTPAAGGSKARVGIEAGMKVGDLSAWLRDEHDHNLLTAPVVPWITVGGAVAMGAHGTGTGQPHFCEQIVELQIVQDVGGAAVTVPYTRPTPGATQQVREDWAALLVSLGALGVIYSVTFECEPLVNAEVRNWRAPMRDTLESGLPALVAGNEYLEIFWFPYNDRCWVKTWNHDSVNAVTNLSPWRRLRDRTQLHQTKMLAPILLNIASLAPWLTPPIMRVFSLLAGNENRVMTLPDALHYQTRFARVLDMGYAIPYDPTSAQDGFDRVKKAWFAVVDRLEALQHQAIYPQNMVLHMRFVGPGGELMAPSAGFPFTCYVEILTYANTPRYAEYFAAVERDWLSLGGRPHWAKLSFWPERIRAAHDPVAVDTFLQVRQRMDPQGVFLNDYLREILQIKE